MASTSLLPHFLLLFTLLLIQTVIRAEPIPLALPIAIALPEALPEPTPLPVPEPEPAPEPEALPEAEAEADPDAQTTYNYAPFSGAIYIVGANGASFSQASPAICPNQAPQGCGNINVWNWCCPSSNTCAWLSNQQVVGCCPSGSSCSGTVNVAAIQTVTVTQYIQQTTTQYVNSNPTVVVGVGQQPTTSTIYQTQPVVSTVTEANSGSGTYINGVFVSVGSTTTRPNTVVYNGYCSTMVASGPDLPTTAQGSCGTILVVNEAGVRSVGWRLPALVVGFYSTLCAMGFWGFRRRI